MLSLTPLSRAAGVKTLVVTEMEAAEDRRTRRRSPAFRRTIPTSTRTRAIPIPTKGAPPKGGSDFGLKGYDSFWVTPGTMLGKVKGEYRTSNIIDPPNGQLPFKDPAGQMKRSGAKASSAT